LSRNYPNPFNPTTNFEVGVAQKAHLQVVIYNTLGQKVATLVDEERGAGFYTVTWNGLTGNGVAAASGVYFARMNASPTSGGKPFVGLQKIVLLK
jgi:flagellar hook assembly protein FlgD